MRILSGPPANWKGEIVCPRCTSRLEIELSDIKKFFDAQREGAQISVDCPTCLGNIYGDASVVPKYLWHRIPGYRG
jgi:hypothetical protein